MSILPFFTGLALGALIAARYFDKLPAWMKRRD
jgi:hypothetical protein